MGMEEAEGFKPPRLLHPTVFKTATHINVSASMVQQVGFEPTPGEI